MLFLLSLSIVIQKYLKMTRYYEWDDVVNIEKVNLLPSNWNIPC